MPLIHESRCRLRHPEYFPGDACYCDCRHKEREPLPRVAHCSFSLYPADDEDPCARQPRGLSLEEMVNLSFETGELWARRENSGCESCYVEVARWSNDRERWERFANCKLMDVWFVGADGEPVDDMDDDDDKADKLVELINTDTDFGFIHGLPGWGGEGQKAKAAQGIPQQIQAFSDQCAAAEYTDTDQVWTLLNSIYLELTGNELSETDVAGSSL